MTARKEKIKETDVGGLKYFDRLAPLLRRLHGDACDRDKAGNRELHFDQYCMLILLYMFNPVVSSLRAIQQASELKKVQRKLGCSRASLGSLSEASQVFNPQLLRGVIEELSKQLKPVAKDPRLANVPHTLTAVDGSLLAALPLLVEATRRKHETGSGSDRPAYRQSEPISPEKTLNSPENREIAKTFAICPEFAPHFLDKPTVCVQNRRYWSPLGF